jgi:hypothetical protein
MPARAITLLPGLAALALLLAGCGGPPPLVPVSGQVSYKGQPLSGGVIVFVPNLERGNRGPLAFAEIGPDGNFTLTTEGKPGCKAGWHRVTVSCAEAGVPECYSDPDLSGKHVEVKPGGAGRFQIELD